MERQEDLTCCVFNVGYRTDVVSSWAVLGLYPRERKCAPKEYQAGSQCNRYLKHILGKNSDGVGLDIGLEG